MQFIRKAELILYKAYVVLIHDRKFLQRLSKLKAGIAVLHLKFTVNPLNTIPKYQNSLQVQVGLYTNAKCE